MSKVFVDSFQRYWWSKSAGIFDQRHTWPHPPTRVSFRCYFPLIIISMQKIKHPLVPPSDIANQRNSAIWLKKRHNWLHPTKSGNLRCYLHLINNSVQKTTIKIDSFKRHWGSKNSVIWLYNKFNLPQQLKVLVSDATFMTISTMANSMHKKLRTKTTFSICSSECFPDLPEISSYLEKIKYVTWI